LTKSFSFPLNWIFLISLLLKGRKLKTTTEALENGQDTGIELKVQAQQQQQQSNQQLPQLQQPTTVTLNPALHSAAGNISASAPPPGVNFINILLSPFSYESVLHSFSLVTVWLCNFFGARILAQKLLVKCLWN